MKLLYFYVYNKSHLVNKLASKGASHNNGRTDRNYAKKKLYIYMKSKKKAK